MIVIGIDLAGVESRPTGFCVLQTDSMKVEHFLVYKDEDIVKFVKKFNPKVVAIDAPLSLPKGRKSLDEKSNIHLRSCDKELLKMGIKFFPITLGPMRKLTKRGIRLKRILESIGYEVIEVYPGGAQDLLDIPRKKDMKGLMRGLVKLGIRGIRKNATNDELDAVTAAYVAKLYVEREFKAYGDKEEGLIIMPK